MPDNRAIVRSIEALGYLIGEEKREGRVVLWAREIKGEGFHVVHVADGDGEEERYRAWVELAIAVGIDVEDG